MQSEFYHLDDVDHQSLHDYTASDDMSKASRNLRKKLFPDPVDTTFHTISSVRVSMLDYGEVFEPDISSQMISDVVFSKSRSAVSGSRIFNDCSHGKFQLAEYEAVASGKKFGKSMPITDILIQAEMEDYYRGLINSTTIIELAKETFVLSHANYTLLPDHVFFILPIVIDEPVYEKERYSFYDADYFDVGNMVRAIGHQIGLTSSGEGSYKDADVTGHMGWRLIGKDLPSEERKINKKCFNAVKSWQLGWYQDRHKTLVPRKNGQQSVVKLFTIAQYSELKPGDDSVIIVKIPMFSVEDDLYIFFNGSRGINSGTGQYHNMIGIYQGTFDTVSYSLAGLIEGASYKIKNFDNEGGTLKISCKSIFIDYFVTVSILDSALLEISLEPASLTASPKTSPNTTSSKSD